MTDDELAALMELFPRRGSSSARAIIAGALIRARTHTRCAPNRRAVQGMPSAGLVGHSGTTWIGSQRTPDPRNRVSVVHAIGQPACQISGYSEGAPSWVGQIRV